MKEFLRKDLGSLVLRLGFGSLMLCLHGAPKLMHFAEKSSSFPDPFSVGHTVSFGLVVFAEAFCSLAVVLGLFTRLMTIPIIITMCVAVFMIHANADLSQRELPLLYALAFFTIFCTGPGRVSMDFWLRKAT